MRHLHTRAKRHAPEHRRSCILEFNGLVNKANMCIGPYRLAETALVLRNAVPSITSDGSLHVVEDSEPTDEAF